MTDRELDELIGRRLGGALRPYVRRMVAEELSAPRTSPAEEAVEDFVYFIEATDADLIKIGRTRNVGIRLTQLQTGTPHRLRPIGIVPCGGSSKSVEAGLHERFAADRVFGEWFRATPELLAVAEEARRRMDARIEAVRDKMPSFGGPPPPEHEAQPESPGRRDGPWTDELRRRAKERRRRSK